MIDAAITSTAAGRRAPISLTPTLFDRILAGGAAVMLVVVLVAIGRGHADWAKVPPLIWFHLATILAALVLTPLMLLRPRGDRLHRRLGMVWMAAMILTALASFGITVSNPGKLSVIHILSAWTLIQVPLIYRAARKHDITRHRRGVRRMVTGALLIAGFFTFPFHRLLGTWLFG